MIPVCKPCWGPEEEAAVLRVMRSGRLIQGPEVEKFEAMVAEEAGAKYAVATSSGTTALHLALLAMGVGPGDEVLVPAFTFVATANAVLMCGAKVVLCDIDLETFCMDSKGDHPCRTAIPVHAFGYPMKFSWLGSYLEDAACALGSIKLKGRAAIFSFHATKTITTGEGGMVVTNDPTLTGDVRRLRDQKHGHGLAYNYRMTEVQGAIGQEQMKKLPWILKRRKEIAAEYDEAFDEQISARIPPKGGNYQSYVLLLDRKKPARVEVFSWLEEFLVEALPATQFLGSLSHLITDGLPNAREASRFAMRIPIFPQMLDTEVAHVIKGVKEVLG